MRIWSLYPKYLDAKGFVTVTHKQMKFEMNHLLKKLKIRDPERFQRLSGEIIIDRSSSIRYGRWKNRRMRNN